MRSSSRIAGFYRLSIAERRQRLREAAGLPDTAGDGSATFAAIDAGGLALEAADGMIENVVGTYALPFAVAVNFLVDGEETFVPMAVEEPSIVAAASNAARMARPRGFHAEVSAPVMIGQIQITHVADVAASAARLRAAADELVARARVLVPRLADRGGGPRSLEVRELATSGPDGGVIVAHLHVDCRDAMGANLVNTLCEALADRVAAIAGGAPGCGSSRTSPTAAPSPCAARSTTPRSRARAPRVPRCAPRSPRPRASPSSIRTARRRTTRAS